jgi:hypothetical protein
LVYPLVEHAVFELADSFADAARYMGDARRTRNPGTFSYTWYPSNGGGLTEDQVTEGGISWTQQPKYGVGTTGAYWVRNLRARATKNYATVEADSGQRPDRAVITHESFNVAVTGGPGPGIASQTTWTRGNRPAPRPVITLTLRNVRGLKVLLRDAGFRDGQRGSLVVRSDGAATIHLADRAVRVGKGRTTVRFRA